MTSEQVFYCVGGVIILLFWWLIYDRDPPKELECYQCDLCKGRFDRSSGGKITFHTILCPECLKAVEEKE